MSLDLLVVGLGPAGVSAMLWSLALDLDALALERGDAPGGQLHLIHFHPPELAGVPAGDGPALAHTYARQLAQVRARTRLEADAIALEPDAAAPAVRLAGGERIAAGAVLVATGARRRTLDVPGARELEGRGVSYSATRDRDRFAGGRVVVVGGGDAAFENALLLAGVGCLVTVVAREAARARPEFRARVAAEPRVEVLEHARPTAVLGDDRVRGVRVDAPGGERELAADGVVVKIGVVPNTEWCAGALALDPDGWIAVDGGFATSAPGVWAAGDVVRPPLASIAVAMGQGALAVAAIRSAHRDS